MSIYNQRPNKRNITKYLNSLKCFRGTKEELESELKKFFKLGVDLYFNDMPIILDTSFIFNFKNDLFSCDITLYYIIDLKGNYYITEFEIQF